MTDFAQRLKNELNARPGIKQSHIANAADVSTQAVSGWLAGKYTISEEKAKLVAEFLGCDWLWLMYGERREDESDNRFQGLPASAREWLDRQVRIVTEFEREHPMLADIMFSEQLPAQLIQDNSAMINLLEQRAQTAVISGSMVLELSGTVLTLDAVTYRILKLLIADRRWTKLGSMATAKGKLLTQLLPDDIAKEFVETMREVKSSGKEAGQIITSGDAVIVVTASLFDHEGLIIMHLIDISDQLTVE